MKKRTAEMVSFYLAQAGARRIREEQPRFRTIDIAVRYPLKRRGKMPDPDNLLKVLLDALVTDRWLHDDSSQWCVFTVSVGRSEDVRQVTTFLTLKEI